MVRENRRAIWGATAALAVCCTVHVIILAGGIGAAASLLGGWLHNPYVLVSGLAIFTIAAAILVIGRTPERDRGKCCPPD